MKFTGLEFIFMLFALGTGESLWLWLCILYMGWENAQKDGCDKANDKCAKANEKSL